MSTLKTNEIQSTSGKTLLELDGQIIQTKDAHSSSSVTVNSSTAQTVISTTMTVKANSKIYVHVTCDMNADSNKRWQIVGFNIAGTQYSDKIIEHTTNANMNASHMALSNALSAGTHTVTFNSRNGVGAVTYNEGNYGRGILMVLHEVVT